MPSQLLQNDADNRQAFLRVESSARGYKWVERLDPGEANIALAIAQTEGLSEILARVLVARGSRPETVRADLDPTLREFMPDPSSLADMDKACGRLIHALRAKEKIAVYGDYDVDGATSAALLHEFLNAHGADVQIYIPDRDIEGYGPNTAAFEQLIADGAALIITVDCGTASHAPVARAAELGTDVVVLDHHQADEQLPPAFALVNPNRQDDTSGLTYLAAVGVVFLFLVATARALRSDGAEDRFDLMQALDLVALGTVCDVVPLVGLNRAYVRRGLEVMHGRRSAGLRALCDVAGLNTAPTPYHLGFVLGPRLNAGGRIGRSSMATELLTASDDGAARSMAEELDRLNADRRQLQHELQDEALSQASLALDSDPELTVLTAQGAGWPKGLVGLVSARLTEQFRLPSFVVTWDEKGIGSASARSIEGVDMGSAVRAAVSKGLLVKGGGHAMAAGFTLERDRLKAFQEYIRNILADAVRNARALPVRRFDGALMASSATMELWRELESAGPFGAGNPQPRFAFAAHRCRYPKIVGNKHVRCSLLSSDASRLDAIAFNSAETPLGDMIMGADGEMLHFSGHLRHSNWGGREKIELHIDDAAAPL